MTYFLDFDRTLFDTDAYNQSLITEPGCAPFAELLAQALSEKRDDTLTGGSTRIEAWNKVSEAITAGTLTFSPGYLERFLYADVAELLRALGNEAIIVTYGEIERQKIKVESALANMVRITTLYTGDKHKAEYLSTWPGYYGAPAIFVDDRAVELEQVAARFPNISLFEMRRDGGVGDGRWPVIRSLAELP